jgi:hypothetical protein
MTRGNAIRAALGRPVVVVAAGCAVVAVVTWWAVLRTYYFGDDYFLMYLGKGLGSGWDNVSIPIFGHFVPGMLWVYWLIGTLGGLSRAAMGVVMAVLMVLVYLGVFVLLSQWRPRAAPWQRATASLLALITSVLPVSIVYLARGGATLPIAVTVLFSASAFVAAYRRSSWTLGALAALVWLPGLLFWELAAANIVFIPLVGWAIVAGSSGVGFLATLRRSPRWPLVSYGVASAMGLALYAYQYIGGGYGSGTPRPSVTGFLDGVARSIPYFAIPSFGGGPVPNLNRAVPLNDGDFAQPGLWIPLGLGALVLVAALAVRRLRPLVWVATAAVVFQCATIVFARWELFAGGIFADLRYAADFVPFFGVLLAVLWLQAMDSSREARPWARWGLRAGLVGSVICALLTSAIVIRDFGGADRAAYVSRVVDGLAVVPASSQLISGPIPSYLGWVAQPGDNTRAVFLAELGEGRWGVGTGRPEIVRADGSIGPAVIASVRSAEIPRGACATAVELSDPFRGEWGLRTVNVTLRVRPPEGADALWVTSGPYEWSLPRGESGVTWQTYGAPGPISISAPSVGACVIHARAFIASP